MRALILAICLAALAVSATASPAEDVIAQATLCDQGQGKDESGTHCVDCVLGSSFSSTKGLGKCSPVTVTTCPAGHGLLAATKKSDGRCIKCLKGTERPEGAQTQACTKCAKGKYSDVNGMDCIACDAGEVALDTGLTSCTPCPKGEVEANTRKACNACAVWNPWRRRNSRLFRLSMNHLQLCWYRCHR